MLPSDGDGEIPRGDGGALRLRGGFDGDEEGEEDAGAAEPRARERLLLV